MSGPLLARHGADVLTALTERSPGRRAAAAALDVPAPVPDATPVLPADGVLAFLVAQRLLAGIPFGYLVPDPVLLPPESIRFFYLDQAWLDACETGVLAVGSAGTRETEHVQATLPHLQPAVRAAVPLAAAVRRRIIPEDGPVRAVRSSVARAVPAQDGGGGVEQPPEETLPGTPCGFLMRSALVSGWPGLSVRAFTTSDIAEGADPNSVDPSLVIPILRMVNLAPAVLLVLFAQVPALVWLEEPHHGIQLGIDPGGTLPLVDVHGGDVPGAEIDPVPMRDAGLGVIDVTELVNQLQSVAQAHPPVAVQGGSAALALQLMREPYRQRFTG